MGKNGNRSPAVAEKTERYLQKEIIAASIVHSKLDYCNSLYYNQAGLTLNLKKCKWAKEQVKYCGKIVGNGKILPDPDKIKIVASMNPPKNRKEWR